MCDLHKPILTWHISQLSHDSFLSLSWQAHLSLPFFLFTGLFRYHLFCWKQKIYCWKHYSKIIFNCLSGPWIVRITLVQNAKHKNLAKTCNPNTHLVYLSCLSSKHLFLFCLFPWVLFFFFSSRFTGHFFLLSFFFKKIIFFFIFIQIYIWRFSIARPVKWNCFTLWFWVFFSNIVVYVVLCGLGIARLK